MTQKTTARSPAPSPQTCIFRALLCALQYAHVVTNRNTIEKLCVAWWREYTHITTGQLLWSDIMQYFPGPYVLIQTRRAQPSGSQPGVRDPLTFPKINRRGHKMITGTKKYFCFAKSCLIALTFKYLTLSPFQASTETGLTANNLVPR